MEGDLRQIANTKADVNCIVMYIQNVHLKLYLYFSDKLLSKRTGILETFVSRGFSNNIKPHGENEEMTPFARS